ncbi:hypothetical protein [Enhygromyxa salina]|uniref:hypothetical protein n=1 Tax=Enhygromyxa salina TaxID=215803 RepID=UPI0011BA7EFB|nr:hypothetical protein [Enhygromyxa salina]
MNTDEKENVALLLGRRTRRLEEMERDGVFPSFLAAKYARESAALEAAKVSDLSPELMAALLRAAFLDEEEDVRAAARHALIVRDEHIGDIIHLALTMDDDPDVRDSAFDEALEVSDKVRRARLIRQAAHALKDDDCEAIRARAMDFGESPLCTNE